MLNKLLTPPHLDDEAVVKLNDFLYDLLDAFETHYAHQIRRYRRDVAELQNEFMRSESPESSSIEEETSEDDLF